MRWPLTILLATVAAAGFAGAGHAGAPTPPAVAVTQPVSAFDRNIAAAKSAMMIDPKVAFRAAETAFKLAEHDASRQGRLNAATAAWLEAEALNRSNAPERAEPVLQSALATVAQLAPNTKLHGDILLALGWAVAAEGHSPTALADFQQAFRIFQLAGERRSQSKALQNIGSIYEEAGDFNHALKYYAESEDTFKNDPILLLSSHNNKGQVYKEMGRLDQAAEEFRAALALAREIHSPLLEVRILTNLANTRVQAGRLNDAEMIVARAFKASERLDAADSWTPFLWGVSAKIALQRGRAAQAAADLSRTFAGSEATTPTLPFREFHETAYHTYKHLGDYAGAMRQLEIVRQLDSDAQALVATKNAALMTAQFDFAEQNLKISELKSGALSRDIALARSRSQLMAGALVAAGLIMLLLTVSMLWIRRSRSEVTRSHRQLEEINTTLEQALKAKSEFFSMVSHEIRTPLNGILGMTQILLADRGLTAAVREKVDIVQVAGKTMRGLVDDILDSAKMEHGGLTIRPSEFDLEQAVSETSRLWTGPATAKGVEVSATTTGAPRRIIADQQRLQQILSNLMANAVKFTSVGSVTLDARAVEDGDGEWLVVTVTDTGIGVPPDKLDDIFVAFRQVEATMTRHFGGTGLGLAISRNLAIAMGGDLAVASVLGEGSTFTLRLPLVRAGIDAMAASAPGPASPTLRQSRLLLVEPNRLAQGVLRATLADKSGGLEIVADLPAALEALARQRFDVVAASLAPGRELEDLRALKAAVSGAAVLALLAGASDVAKDDLLAAGAARVLTKPLPQQTLLDALEGIATPGALDEAPFMAAAAG